MWTRSGVSSTFEDILPERSVLAFGSKTEAWAIHNKRWTEMILGPDGGIQGFGIALH